MLLVMRKLRDVLSVGQRHKVEAQIEPFRGWYLFALANHLRCAYLDALIPTLVEDKKHHRRNQQ